MALNLQRMVPPSRWKTKLDRHVRKEEAKGAYKHYSNPADFLDELKARNKSARHALRTAAA